MTDLWIYKLMKYPKQITFSWMQYAIFCVRHNYKDHSHNHDHNYKAQQRQSLGGNTCLFTETVWAGRSTFALGTGRKHSASGPIRSVPFHSVLPHIEHPLQRRMHRLAHVHEPHSKCSRRSHAILSWYRGFAIRRTTGRAANNSPRRRRRI